MRRLIFYIQLIAGVVEWYNASFPRMSRGFDSLHPLTTMAVEARLFNTKIIFGVVEAEKQKTCKDCVHYLSGSSTEPQYGYCQAMMHFGAQRRGLDAWLNRAAPDMPYESAPFVREHKPCKAFYIDEETGEVTTAWTNVPIERE